MHLFKLPQPIANQDNVDLSIKTPIGILDFSTKINQQYLDPDSARGFLLPSRAEVAIWDNEQFRLEVLQTEVKPKLPKGMSVDRCKAVVWRIKSKQDGLEVAFEARWRELPHDIQSFPETGEGLEAQSWNNEQISLMIGTEDGDFLGRRTSRDAWLPIRFAFLSDDSEELCTYLDDGMRIIFPPINKGEVVQAQFVTAFVEKEKDISPWYAVDRNFSELLESAGVS